MSRAKRYRFLVVKDVDSSSALEHSDRWVIRERRLLFFWRHHCSFYAPKGIGIDKVVEMARLYAYPDWAQL